MRLTRLLSPDSGGGGGQADERPEGNDRVASAEALAEAATARYRQVVAAQPGLVPELVRGGTPDEIDASVEEARRAYEEVSRRIATQHEREVPTGNLARSAHTLGAENLKPEAKIALGLRAVRR